METGHEARQSHALINLVEPRDCVRKDGNGVEIRIECTWQKISHTYIRVFSENKTSTGKYDQGMR